MPRATGSIHGLRILVVEDEALIAEEIAERLQQAGAMVVAICDNGVDAIQRALDLRPGIILMDIRLKGDMDGIHASEVINARVRIPVVYLTAHSDFQTLQRARAGCAYGYVLKPFHIKSLLVAIEVAIDRFDTDQQLEESHMTYATILGSIKDAVIASDSDGRVRFMNAVAERLTGCAIREAQGAALEELLQLVGADGRSRSMPPVALVLRTRKAITLGRDEYIRTREGNRVPVEGGVTPVIDDLGRLVGATVVLRDVTDARRAEAEMKALTEQFRAVIETAVDGVLLLDAAGTILLFNPACERLFGCTSDEAVGRSIEMLLPSALLDDYGWPLQTGAPGRRAPALIKGRAAGARTKDGRTVPVEVSVGEAANGGQSAFVAVIHDVSERKQLEATLLDAIGREQRRFADDLHDGLGQDLTGLSLLLGAFARAAAHGVGPAAQDLERAHEVARHAIASCRSIAHGLSPVTATQGGLVAGLRALVARLNTGSGPTVDFSSFEATRLGLSPSATEHLYRIAQEALSNALRHAHATAIKVTLDVEATKVRLEICDDGDGVQVGATGEMGLGLRTMRYRASLLGARFQISPSEPAGTCIVCECPQAA